MAFKVFFTALLLLGALAYHSEARANPDAEMIARHERWMARFGRVYKDEAEKAKRFQIFKQNAEHIDTVNAAGLSYKLGENAFADLTNEEFRASRNRYTRHHARCATQFKYDAMDLQKVPTSVDWRTKGAVTPIKDQGQCGSCWAFSTIAATEGIHEIKTGKLVSLSEQELVDCDKTDYGCEGGEMQNGFEFIVKNGITTESNYPYAAADDTCNTKKMKPIAATLTGYQNVPANNETALQLAAVNQPISVAIDASGSDFQLYTSGIFAGSCGTDLDHGVTLVGYGVSGKTKYWIVKNSWGTSWGEQGYIRMKRGVGKAGICGIAMDASYPTA